MSPYKVIHRSEHPISRKNVNPEALKVLYRLKNKGFMAMLVGGALRDLYRKKQPRDFDVVTNADIDQIRAQFRNSKTIGKRFPIVHVYFGSEVVEISSFKGEDGASPEELILADALRRDFTVNAVYYNLRNFEVVDPIGGLDDIIEGRVISLGDPVEKFDEDPIRMLRAVKLVAKQGFSLDKAVENAIAVDANRFSDVGAGRRYEELTRVFLDEDVGAILEQCSHHGLLRRMWPKGEKLFKRLGISYFEQVRKSFPLLQSRGSFTKQTHMYLWFRLFMDSDYFQAATHPAKIKNAFESFVEPLGVPFRAPILETLLAISLVKLQRDTRLEHCLVTRDVQKLLEYYVAELAPDQASAIEKALHARALLKNKNPRKGKARDHKPHYPRRRRRAKSEKK